jgi:hypothetical protein
MSLLCLPRLYRGDVIYYCAQNYLFLIYRQIKKQKSKRNKFPKLGRAKMIVTIRHENQTLA